LYPAAGGRTDNRTHIQLIESFHVLRRQLLRRRLVAAVLVQRTAAGLHPRHMHSIAQLVEHSYPGIDRLDISQPGDTAKE
jgi:hypothetical protein